MTFRLSMVLTNKPQYPSEDQLDHVTRIAGCRDENHARQKCRDIYGNWLVGIKTVKAVED